MLPAAPYSQPRSSTSRARRMAAIAAGVLGLIIFAALAVMALAAAIVGGLVAAIVLVGRAMGARERDETLEARRTAEGWVVEARG